MDHETICHCYGQAITDNSSVFVFFVFYFCYITASNHVLFHYMWIRVVTSSLKTWFDLIWFALNAVNSNSEYNAVTQLARHSIASRHALLITQTVVRPPADTQSHLSPDTESKIWQSLVQFIMACPHLFPKQDILFPFPDTKFLFRDTNYPVSETSVDRP